MCIYLGEGSRCSSNLIVQEGLFGDESSESGESASGGSDASGQDEIVCPPPSTAQEEEDCFAPTSSTPSSAPASSSSVPAPDGHKYWWIARSNRGATCSGCSGSIAAWDVRVVFDPNAKHMSPIRTREWKNVFWRYYHMRADCLANEKEPIPVASNSVVDLARTPKRMPETDGEYKALRETLQAQFFSVHRVARGESSAAASSSGGAASSSGGAAE